MSSEIEAPGPGAAGSHSSVAPPRWLPPVPGPEAPGSPLVPSGDNAAAYAQGDLDAPPLAERSGMWPRIAAYILDAGLAALIAFPLAALLSTSSSRDTALEIILVFAAWAAVRVLSPALTGESPGKRFLSIATVDRRGRPISNGTRALRELVVWLLYWIPLVAFIDAAFAERRGRRGFRDRLAGTTVVRLAPVGGGRVAAVLVLGLIAFWTAGLSNGSSTIDVYESDPSGVAPAPSTRSAPAPTPLPASPSTPAQSAPRHRPLPAANSQPRLRAQVIAGCVRAGASRRDCTCWTDHAAREVTLRQLQAVNDAIARRQLPDEQAVAAIGRAQRECRRVTSSGSPA